MLSLTYTPVSEENKIEPDKVIKKAAELTRLEHLYRLFLSDSYGEDRRSARLSGSRLTGSSAQVDYKHLSDPAQADIREECCNLSHLEAAGHISDVCRRTSVDTLVFLCKSVTPAERRRNSCRVMSTLLAAWRLGVLSDMIWVQTSGFKHLG